MTYIYLKRGANQSTQTPIVEHIVPDGSYDISKKPLAPPAPEPQLTESTVVEEKILLEEPSNLLAPMEESITFKTDSHVTETIELIDLPPDPPKTSRIDRLLWPIGILILFSLVTVALSMRGIVTLPFLKDKSQVQTVPTYIPGSPLPSPTEAKPKFGFPQVESDTDPWTGKPIEKQKSKTP